MKNLSHIFLIIFISYFISGCSSTKKLTIQTLQPSEIEKDKIHTIKVERFINDDINQTISLENQIANKVIDNQKIFILKYDLFGTDAILDGEVLNSSVDVHPYYRNDVDYARCRYYRHDERGRRGDCVEYVVILTPCEDRIYNVTTNVKIIKPTNNSIIFSKTYDKSSRENICFDHAYPFRTGISADRYRVNSQIADDIAQEVLNDISPHYVYFDINIIEELDDKNISYTKEQRNRFKNIANLIQTSNLDVAKNQLEVLDNELNHQSFEVIYNLGLIYEAFNQLGMANNLYNQAKLLTLNPEYLNLINYGINRTNTNLQQKIKAKSQLP